MAEEGIDRISELPEGILHHILSFLETKDGIQTCVASKRLKEVWSTIPYIDLGADFFPVLSDDEEEEEDGGDEEDDNDGNGEEEDDERVNTDDEDGNNEQEDERHGEDSEGSNIDKGTQTSGPCEEKDDKEELVKILKKREQLFAFIEETLRRRTMHGLTIQKFRLGYTKLDVELRRNLDLWIHSLVECNIKDLVLTVSLDDKGYDLPRVLLSATSLRALSLNRCMMPCGAITLSSLRKLTLHYVCINDQFLKDIISTCRDLEDLDLDWCTGLTKPIHISGQSQLMKFLRFRPHYQSVVDEFVVEAQHLEKFSWAGGGFHSIKIDIITNCQGSLKFLVLYGADITNKWFCKLISKLPCLQELRLAQLSLKAIEISSSSLKRLSLSRVFVYKDNKFGEFKINTPNLVYLSYRGDLSSVFLDRVAVKEVLLEIEEVMWYFKPGEEQPCSKLMQFLGYFDYSGVVTLGGNTCFKQLIFPVEARSNLLAPLGHIKHLVLEGRYGNIGTCPVEVLADLLENLLWISSNLDNLSLRGIYCKEEYDPNDSEEEDDPSIDLLIKFTFEKLSTGSGDKCCDCINFSWRCWRHSLTYVKYELKGVGADAEVDRCLKNYFTNNAKLLKEIDCHYCSL